MNKRTDSFYIEELRKLGLDLDIENVKELIGFQWKVSIAMGYIIPSIFMSIGILGLLTGFLIEPGILIGLPVYLSFIGLATYGLIVIRKVQKIRLKPYKQAVKYPVTHGLQDMKRNK